MFNKAKAIVMVAAVILAPCKRAEPPASPAETPQLPAVAEQNRSAPPGKPREYGTPVSGVYVLGDTARMTAFLGITVQPPDQRYCMEFVPEEKRALLRFPMHSGTYVLSVTTEENAPAHTFTMAYKERRRAATVFFYENASGRTPMIKFADKPPVPAPNQRDGDREEFTMDQCIFYMRQNIEMSKNVQQLDETPPPKQQ